MATRKQNASKGEPAEPKKTARGADLPSNDVEEEDLVVDEDDASDFFEGSDEYPGDRRRDPLRRPV